MKNYIVVMFFFFAIISCNTSPSVAEGQKFFSVVSWGDAQEAMGVVMTQVTIDRLTNTNLSFSLIKDMTPFSQVLVINTSAIIHEGKYEFKGIDNWGNEYFGYIKFNNDQITLYLDCKIFSGQANSVARLYGSTVLLVPGSIDF